MQYGKIWTQNDLINKSKHSKNHKHICETTVSTKKLWANEKNSEKNNKWENNEYETKRNNNDKFDYNENTFDSDFIGNRTANRVENLYMSISI